MTGRRSWLGGARARLFWSVGLTLVTLLAGAAAVVLADFGAPLWWFLPLFAWLASVGLPATAGVLLVVSCWGTAGLTGFHSFAFLAAANALVFQTAAVWLVARVAARHGTARS